MPTKRTVGRFVATAAVIIAVASVAGAVSASSLRFADFFGTQREKSQHTAMWQWSLGSADYDQIDTNKRLPLTMH
jgi:hypothetical protein